MRSLTSTPAHSANGKQPAGSAFSRPMELLSQLDRSLFSSIPRRLRPRRFVKRIGIVVCFFLVWKLLFSSSSSSSDPSRTTRPSPVRRFFSSSPRLDQLRLPPDTPHPLTSRLSLAASNWHAKLSRQSQSYPSFLNEYVRRYGLPPPPGMERWYEKVTREGHQLVDEYDGLMEELKPFRAMGGKEVLRRTLEIASMPTFSLLNVTAHHSYFYGQDYRGAGAPVSRENYGPGIERVEGFASMLQPNINEIPDGTIFAVSELAEPRVIVPWQDHPSTLADLARLQTSLLSTTTSELKARHRSLTQSFASSDETFAAMMAALPRPNVSELLPTPNFRGDGSAWELYARSCPPESPARKQVASLKAESAGSATVGRGVVGKGKGKQKVMPDGSLLTRGFKRGFGKLAKRATGGSEGEEPVTVEKVEKLSEGPQPKRRWPAKPSLDKTVPPTSSDDHLLALPPPSSDPLARARLSSLPRHLASAALESPGKAYRSAKATFESDAFRFVEVGRKGIAKEVVCEDETVHQIQGAFYSDWRAVPAMYPVFSPSKIDGFSDILIPSNFYYGDDDRYSLDSWNNQSRPWHEKESKLFWRGKTTGGGNSPPRHQLQYQRHRFVRMAQSLSRSAQSLLLPSNEGVLTHVKRAVGDLNRAWLDVGFTGYTGCGDPDICEITESMYPLKESVPLRDMANYKAVLDLDGMAFSGRFATLLGMGSVVFKSTIFRDFASDWIEPFYHYVPVSSGYEELYNLLAYFLPLPKSLLAKAPSATQTLLRRFKGEPQSQGDAALEQIAKNSLDWSQQFGGKPDIEAFAYRLALEWARILHDESEQADVVYRVAQEEQS